MKRSFMIYFMKHALSKFLALLAVFLIVACAQEESISMHEQTSKKATEIKSRFVNLDNMANKESIKQQLSDLHLLPSEGTAQRTITSKNYNFSIDTENVLVIEKGFYQSLTFLVTREVNNGYVEALFLHPYNDTYLPFLFQYDLSQSDIDALNDGREIPDLVYKTRFATLSNLDIEDFGNHAAYNEIDDGEETYKWINGECYRVNKIWEADGMTYYNYVKCPGCDCPEPTSSLLPNPVKQNFQIIEIMDWNAGSYNESWPAPFSPFYPHGPSKGGGGNLLGSPQFSNPQHQYPMDPQDPVLADISGPVTGVISPDLTRKSDNCNKLKEMVDDPELKSAMTDLKDKVYQSKEYGHAVEQSNGDYSSTQCEASAANPNQINVSSYLGGNFIGLFHTHPDPALGYIPMFSTADILYLWQVARMHDPEGPRDYSDYFITVTTSKGTFALKIKDFLEFSTALNSNSFKELNKELKDQMSMRDPQGNVDDLAFDLLTFIQKYDMGIELYQASSDLSSWSKVELSGQPSNPITKKPC